MSLRARQANNQAIHQALASPAAPQTIKPTPSAFNSYQVPALDPRYISIPKINVKAIVTAAGLTSNGAIGTPNNVFNTAWYNRSSKPGQPGAVLIDGHVSSWTTNGVFYNLRMLSVGDSIQIERGDGTIITYTVAKVQTYTAEAINMAKILAPIDPAKPGLNLITCAGDVIKGTNEFDKRIVVYSTQTSVSP